MKSTCPASLGAAAKRLLRLAGNHTDLKTAVEAIAERLLVDVVCPPTDFQPLYEKLKVIKCEEADIPVNGELRRLGRFYEIYYSSQQNEARRRFTIAHELGHAILESTGPRCPQSGEEVERICDMLATALLLPRGQFTKAIGNDLSPRAILAVANQFDVSVMAAALRFSAIFRVSVFEVVDDRIIWGQGLIKKGYITGDIKPIVDKSMISLSGEETVMLNDGRNRVMLRWSKLGYGRRILFTALPVH